MSQFQAHHHSTDENTAAEAPDLSISSTAQEGTAELDSLLDEIDGLLEDNAEEFVKSFVQKGGQ